MTSFKKDADNNGPDEEPFIAQPAISELAIAHPAIPEPAIPEPAIPEPAIPEPAIPEPAIAQPAIQPAIRMVLSILALIACLLMGWLFLKYVDLAFIKKHLIPLRLLMKAYPVRVMAAYCLVYVLVTGLSIPGSGILSLAGGALFGVAPALIMSSLSGSLGALLAFWMSRYFLKQLVSAHFGRHLAAVSDGIKQNGVSYLFTLRLLPIFPFILVNLLMGLTPIKPAVFGLVTFCGLLFSNFAYVFAGHHLRKIHSYSDVLSWKVFCVMALVLVVYFLTHWALERLMKKRR